MDTRSTYPLPNPWTRPIPKGARDRFGLTGGQRLIVLADEEGIALLPAEKFEEKMKQAMEQLQKAMTLARPEEQGDAG